MPDSFLMNKIIGIVFIIVGFLLAASGYRYGTTGTMVGGLVLIGIGVVLLILKIIRRNNPRSPG
jgi:hypothetical protein